MHIYWKDPNDNCKIEKCGNYFISNIKTKYEIINKIPKKYCINFILRLNHNYLWNTKIFY